MKHHLFNKIHLGLILTTFLLSFVSIACAQTSVDSTYTPLAPLPDLSSQTGQLQTSVNFSSYVTYVFNLLVAGGAVAAVLMITWGGFQYMTSDAINGKKEGLSKLKNSIYGLILLLSSILILRTINPQFAQIPSGLVPPANLAQPINNKIADWLQTMDSVSAQYQQQSDAAIYAKNAAKAKVADLTQQLALAQANFAKNCGGITSTTNYSADCASALASLYTMQDKLNAANGNLVYTTYQANSSGILNTVNSGGDAVNGVNTFAQSDPATLQKAINAEQASYNAAVTGLNQNGADPTQLQNIQNQHVVSNMQLTVQQAYDLYKPSSSGNNPGSATVVINTIKSAISTLNKIASSTTDKTILSNIAAAKQTAEGEIQKITQEQQSYDAIQSMPPIP